MTGTLPLTILGGFLGAGKTTLVNHLLRNASGLRLAVLVNEFGELPIDADLIEAQDEDLISISGGCVCCSYGSDLTAALMDLAKMAPRPDHVLLEASGVAVPGAIAATVGLLQDYRTDGVIVLADAETLRANAVDRYMGDTVIRQLDDADLLILNKCDLVTAETLSDLKRWLGGRPAAPRILESRHAVVDPSVILNSAPGVRRPAAAALVNPVRSVVLTFEHPVADAQVLAESLASSGLNLLRAKGFVTGGEGNRYLIQVVGRRVNCTPVDLVRGTDDCIVCLGLKDQADWAAVKALKHQTSLPGKPDPE